jgi:16S rRNA (adenine1518-N6/adenine1519-N6)-dimethyltransferase
MAQLDDLPPLRAVIAEHGLAASKALGQNFILDLNLTARIARAGGPLAGADVLEIGPGPGGLTRALLAEGAGRVIAIERDRRCLPALAEIAARYPGRLTVHEGDALAIDHPALGLSPGARVIANLPYNIATPLIIGWIKSAAWPPWFASLTLMVQKEVADRLTADERTPADYGRLSVLTGWRMQAKTLFTVPPSAFTPAPKVMSAVVLLTPRPEPLPCDVGRLERVTAAAFGQRRKMLRQSLKSLGDAEALLEAAGIAPDLRPERLPIAGFVALANALARPVKDAYPAG